MSPGEMITRLHGKVYPDNPVASACSAGVAQLKYEFLFFFTGSKVYIGKRLNGDFPCGIGCRHWRTAPAMPKTAQSRPPIKTHEMPTIVIRHKVGDFATWLAGHQDRVNIFSRFGSGFKTFQDADDPNSIVLVAEVDDMEGLQKTLSDPEVMIKIARDKHTVLEPVTVSLPVEV